MSEKTKKLLVVDTYYLFPEYKDSSTEEVLKTLKILTGFENILLIDSSRVNTQCFNNNNNNPPVYTL